MATPREPRMTNIYGAASLEYLIKLVSEHPEIYKVSTRSMTASDQLPPPARKAWNQVMIQMRQKYGRELQDFLVWKSWRSLRVKYGSHSCAAKWLPHLSFLKSVVVPRKPRISLESREEGKAIHDEEMLHLDDVGREDSAYDSRRNSVLTSESSYDSECVDRTPETAIITRKITFPQHNKRKAVKKERGPFESLLWGKWTQISASENGEELINMLKKRILAIVSDLHDENDAQR